MPPTILTLSLADRRNTSISTPDGVLLYMIETRPDHIFSTNPTSVYRLVEGVRADRELVARLGFHKIAPADILFNGAASRVDWMFPKKGWLSSSVYLLSVVS